nr:hypothetical protein [Tanacetum cinerariifolium]
MSNDDERDHTNSPMITKPELKIGNEFLKILQDNSFNGMDRSDVTGHITKVLELTEWIKIPNVDKDKLRLHVLLKSLSEDAEKWWNNEGTTTTWKELGDKFFHKYYLLSYTCNGKIPDYLDHETNYFEFLYWLASKFDNYWEIDKNTKSDGKDIYELIEMDYSPIPILDHRDVSNPDELCKTEEFTVIRYSTAF